MSRRAACAQPFLVLPEEPAAASCEEKAHGVSEVPERMCCLTCGQVFGSREEQVSRTEQCEVEWGWHDWWDPAVEAQPQHGAAQCCLPTVCS